MSELDIDHAMQEMLDEFNKKYDHSGIAKLDIKALDLRLYCAEGLKTQVYVIGANDFFPLRDEPSRQFYLNQKNWECVAFGGILIQNLFINNATILHEILEVQEKLDLLEDYEKDYLFYDPDKIAGRKVDTFESFLMKYGPSLLDHKRANRPDKSIVNIFNKIMNENSKRDNFIKYWWEFRFFSMNQPKTRNWKMFINFAGEKDDRFCNKTHVYDPIVRFSRRILFLQTDEKTTKMKLKSWKIDYSSQEDYNASIRKAVAHLWKIGKAQDKMCLSKRHAKKKKAMKKDKNQKNKVIPSDTEEDEESESSRSTDGGQDGDNESDYSSYDSDRSNGDSASTDGDDEDGDTNMGGKSNDEETINKHRNKKRLIRDGMKRRANNGLLTQTSYREDNNNNKHNHNNNNNNHNHNNRKRPLSQIDSDDDVQSYFSFNGNKRRKLNPEYQGRGIKIINEFPISLQNSVYKPRINSSPECATTETKKTEAFELTPKEAQKLMRNESEALKGESKIMLVDIRDPLVAIRVCQFQILSNIIGNIDWIYDQRSKKEEVDGWISNFCHLRREEAFIIVPKTVKKKDVGNVEKIYRDLRGRLTQQQSENLSKYLEQHDSEHYNHIKDSVENARNLYERNKKLLAVFQRICNLGLPMIMTRNLQLNKRDVIEESPYINQGAVDRMIIKAINKRSAWITGYEKDNIENLIMIGECYYFREKELIDNSYCRQIGGWFIEITDKADLMEKIENEYPKDIIDEDQKSKEWSQKLKKLTIPNHYEMRIWYNVRLFKDCKNQLLNIIKGENFQNWITETAKVTLYYGIGDREKLENIRLLYNKLESALSLQEQEQKQSDQQQKQPQQQQKQLQNETEQQPEQQQKQLQDQTEQQDNNQHKNNNKSDENGGFDHNNDNSNLENGGKNEVQNKQNGLDENEQLDKDSNNKTDLENGAKNDKNNSDQNDIVDQDDEDNLVNGEQNKKNKSDENATVDQDKVDNKNDIEKDNEGNLETGEQNKEKTKSNEKGAVDQDNNKNDSEDEGKNKEKKSDENEAMDQNNDNSSLEGNKNKENKSGEKEKVDQAVSQDNNNEHLVIDKENDNAKSGEKAD